MAALKQRMGKLRKAGRNKKNETESSSSGETEEEDAEADGQVGGSQGKTGNNSSAAANGHCG